MSENKNPPVHQREPNTRLFVGSLPYKFTEGELLSLFVPFGRIVSLKIMHNPWGKSRGLGFVEFDNLNSAIEAKTKLHNFHLDDRSIIVDYSEPDPFNTPEGQLRHQQAVIDKEKRYSKFAKNTPSSRKSPQKTFEKKVIKPIFGSVRQSVYDQRTHHSRIGAKFASRSRLKGKG